MFHIEYFVQINLLYKLILNYVKKNLLEIPNKNPFVFDFVLVYIA